MPLIFLLQGLAHAQPETIEVCASCHGEDGTGLGFPKVPIIAGIPSAHLEEALYSYIDGARQCAYEPTMCENAASLSDVEVAQLAEHYGAMKRAWSGDDFDPGLADKGELIHDKLCSRCHVAPEDKEVSEALGIPLHGQRSAYLRYALNSYQSGEREQLLPAMAEKLELLEPDDIEALINFYASYRGPP